jgi:hypothetical protein
LCGGQRYPLTIRTGRPSGAQRLQPGQQIRADQVHATVRAGELRELEMPGPVRSHQWPATGYGGRIFR